MVYQGQAQAQVAQTPRALRTSTARRLAAAAARAAQAITQLNDGISKSAGTAAADHTSPVDVLWFSCAAHQEHAAAASSSTAPTHQPALPLLCMLSPEHTDALPLYGAMRKLCSGARPEVNLHIVHVTACSTPAAPSASNSAHTGHTRTWAALLRGSLHVSAASLPSSAGLYPMACASGAAPVWRGQLVAPGTTLGGTVTLCAPSCASLAVLHPLRGACLQVRLHNHADTGP